MGSACWRWVLTGTCGPVERGGYAAAAFLEGFVTFSGVVYEELKCMGRIQTGEFNEGLSPVGGTRAGAGEGFLSLHSERNNEW